ncbi:MAG: hypothetical protein KTR30_12330, partial [Saprospiraceae bacterium]|nr:hypothetical protein [Saprospiraceae bacterium]
LYKAYFIDEGTQLVSEKLFESSSLLSSFTPSAFSGFGGSMGTKMAYTKFQNPNHFVMVRY